MAGNRRECRILIHQRARFEAVPHTEPLPAGRLAGRAGCCPAPREPQALLRAERAATGIAQLLQNIYNSMPDYWQHQGLPARAGQAFRILLRHGASPARQAALLLAGPRLLFAFRREAGPIVGLYDKSVPSEPGNWDNTPLGAVNLRPSHISAGVPYPASIPALRMIRYFSLLAAVRYLIALARRLFDNRHSRAFSR